MELTPEDIRKLLDYCPETGNFIWKKRNIRLGFERIDKGWNTRFAGKKVKPRYHRHGHCQIGIFCKNYMAHRIAWAHFYGEHPNGYIDHINNNPKDNKISNLRIATQSQNMANARIRKNNTSGFKGVSWSKRSQKWYAYINTGNKMVALGLFVEFKDAVRAREKAEKEFFGEFARNNYISHGQAPEGS